MYRWGFQDVAALWRFSPHESTNIIMERMIWLSWEWVLIKQFLCLPLTLFIAFSVLLWDKTAWISSTFAGPWTLTLPPLDIWAKKTSILHKLPGLSLKFRHSNIKQTKARAKGTNSLILHVTAAWGAGGLFSGKQHSTKMSSPNRAEWYTGQEVPQWTKSWDYPIFPLPGMHIFSNKFNSSPI